MLVATWFYAFLIALAIVPLLAWAVLDVLRLRRRRRGLPVISNARAMLLRGWAIVTCLLLGVLATAVGLNRQYQYIPSFAALSGDVSPDLVSAPPTVQAPRGATGGAATHVGNDANVVAATGTSKMTHGAVQKVEVAGSLSGIPARDTYVYLPPQYFDPANAHARFPVLYLLHGSPGISVDWLRGGHLDVTMDDLLQEHRIQPFIVVMPDVNGGYSRDTECQDIPGGPQVQTYLTYDVPRYIDRWFRTLGDRNARVIGGLSSGGYCALNLALRHQDVFSAAVSHSGYLAPARNGYTGNLFRNKAALYANAPSAYLATIPIQQPFGVYLDAGSTDTASVYQSKLAYRILLERHVPVTLRIHNDEGHNFSAWSRNLHSSLPWVSRWFVLNHVSVTTPA
ncbi:MAG TPA: alpha/beta fold hydrolase [Acidimicrobiia bacterium]|nr:alpha/beta fold hydrolase [Acidimicrobiia bacterium]